MNAETQTLHVAHSAVPLRDNRPWPRSLALLSGTVVLLFALYWPTVASLVQIWSRSDTFAHGWLIAPISLYLIWTRREQISRMEPSPDWLGIAALAAASLAWLIAAAGQVQVVQQYALVAMVIFLVTGILGRHVVRALAFPLAFLFLAVPVGEVLIPPLMDWTAAFTVGALRMTGIPVFQEGTFFSIPSGNWSVVEGCSGLRYLIASVTVGLLYAYLTYSKLSKRLVFTLLSVIVPIVANGLRAYMIVMIAHLSGMKLALGVDHLIYGWVFFGIVMLLLFAIGSRWRDPVTDTVPSGSPVPTTGWRATPLGSIGAAALAALLLTASPLWAAHIDRMNNLENGSPLLVAPVPAGGWVLDASSMTDWRPRYVGAASSLFQTYRKGDRIASVYIAYYRNQHKGAELLTTQNLMVIQKHPVWDNLGEVPRHESFANGSHEVRETYLRSARQRLLVWDWFNLNSIESTSLYVGKLVLARDRLLGRGDDAVAIILATPYDASQMEVARDTLREFAQDMLPSVRATLAQAARQSATPIAVGSVRP